MAKVYLLIGLISVVGSKSLIAETFKFLMSGTSDSNFDSIINREEMVYHGFVSAPATNELS